MPDDDERRLLDLLPPLPPIDWWMAEPDGDEP